MRHIAFLTLIVVLASMVSAPILAEDKKPNREREQIRRLQQSLQKAEQEKVSLQQEKSAVDDELKASGEKIQSLEKTAQRVPLLSRQISVLDKEKAVLNTRLLEGDKRMTELSEAQRKSLAENVRLQSLLAKKDKELAISEAKNLQLYKYSVELLEKYQNKGFFSAIAQAEPFTGLKRVEIENLLDEYRDKLDAQRTDPATR